MGWSWMTGYDRWWMWLVNRIVMTGEGCNGLRLGPLCVDYMPSLSEEGIRVDPLQDRPLDHISTDEEALRP